MYAVVLAKGFEWLVVHTLASLTGTTAFYASALIKWPDCYEAYQTFETKVDTKLLH